MSNLTKSDLLTLSQLLTKTELVPVDGIPLSFKDDFDQYFFGKTMVMDDSNKLFVHPHDIKNWVRFIFEKYA